MILEAEADGDRGFRRGRYGNLVDAALLRRDRLAGVDRLKPAKRHGITRRCSATLVRLLTLDREDAGRPFLLAVAADEMGTVRDLARQHTRERQLAARLGVQGLEHISGRLGVFEFQAPRRIGNGRGFVPQSLQQAQNAVAVLGRPQQHRTDETVPQLLGQIVEDRVVGRRDV